MITNFHGDYFFLSNFYPFVFTYNRLLYFSTEAAYQAQKTTDMKKREAIAAMMNPAHAKRAGRYLELRPNWEQIKVPIMREILEIKFADPILRKKLLDTGDEFLIEGNTWGDKFWGAVLNKSGEWQGQNWLGKLLMQIRQQI